MKVSSIIIRGLAKNYRFIQFLNLMKKFSLGLLVLLSSSLLGEESVSNAELSRKLDLILGKVGGLEERVGKLESDNKEVKKEVKQVAQSAAEAKTATENLQIPSDEKEKESFLISSKMKSILRKQRFWPLGKAGKLGKVEKNLPAFKIRRSWGSSPGKTQQQPKD